MSTDRCRRIQVARSGYMSTVSRRHNYYSFMSLSWSTCIPLYPATDKGQFCCRYKNMLSATSGYNMCPGVNAAYDCSDRDSDLLTLYVPQEEATLYSDTKS